MTERRLQKKLAKIQKKGEQYKRIRELEDIYVDYMPEKKTRKVSNVMLIIIIIAIVGYALVDVWLQYNTGMELSSTLTSCWYAFWGAEIVALAAIKTSKVKHNSDDYPYDDMNM